MAGKLQQGQKQARFLASGQRQVCGISPLGEQAQIADWTACQQCKTRPVSFRLLQAKVLQSKQGMQLTERSFFAL